MGDNRKLDPRLLWGMTIAGLLFVLYFRLIPFDVDLSGGLPAMVARFTWQPLSIKDIPINLLIFIPFSFGVAGLLYQSGRPWPRVTWITVLIVLALSTAIEVLQVYIPQRVPSFSDIITNGLSAVLGVLFYRLAVFGLRRAIVRYASPVTVLAGLAVYAGFIALLTTYLFWSAGLSTWADAFPLTLGNENSDFRPWEGEIAEIVLLDRAVSATEAAELLAGNLPEDTLAAYQINGPAPYADQQGTLPPLQWQPDDTSTVAVPATGATVGAAQWLATDGSIAPFSSAAREAGAFTMAGDFTAALERQRGPARIISVSADSGHRNITLGQQGDALSIRLRTPSSGVNGEKPEMIIPGFFLSPEPRRVIVTYDAPSLTVYTDAPATTHTVSLAPGLTFFQDFTQINRWLLGFPANPHLFDFRYWSLMIIPALLAAAILVGIRDAAIGRTIIPAIEPRD